MTITKRVLTKWRKEALKALAGGYPGDAMIILFEDHCNRILLMTQELLDQHLLKEINKDA